MSLSTVCSTAAVESWKNGSKNGLKNGNLLLGVRPSTSLVLPVLACQIALKSNSQTGIILDLKSGTMVAGVYLICKHDRISDIIAIEWSNWMSNKLDKNVRLRQTCSWYHIVENIGGRKHWWIWRIDGQSPKFSPSNLWIFNIRILFVGHSPKFSSPNNPNSWILRWP